VELPPVTDEYHDTFIDPLTIPGVNHHMVDKNSQVVSSLTQALESEDPLMFLDLYFAGTLYQINKDADGMKPKQKLISFTGWNEYDLSYSLFGGEREVAHAELRMDILLSGHIMAEIRKKQEKYTLRFAPSEGLHRLFVFINHLYKTSKLVESGLLALDSIKFQRLELLLKRKIKLVLLNPKPQQSVPDFLDSSYQSSLHVERLRKVLAPHTFLDNVKNCVQMFKYSPTFIVNSGFFAEQSLDWSKAQPIVDKIFLIHLMKNEVLNWLQLDPQCTPINETKGLLIVGRRHFINSVMKAKEPRSPKLCFIDKDKKKQIELTYEQICLYCFLIAMCFSEQNCSKIESYLKTHDGIFSNHRISKFENTHKYSVCPDLSTNIPYCLFACSINGMCLDVRSNSTNSRITI
jgi:hypothetical protein